MHQPKQTGPRPTHRHTPTRRDTMMAAQPTASTVTRRAVANRARSVSPAHLAAPTARMASSAHSHSLRSARSASYDVAVAQTNLTANSPAYRSFASDGDVLDRCSRVHFF